MSALAYTAAELAEALGVSERHIYRMAKRPGGPPTLTLGRRTLFPRKAVDRWLDQQAERTVEAAS